MVGFQLHKDFIASLLELKQARLVERVMLVSRLYSDDFGPTKDDKLYVFLPDLHLMTAAGDQHFRFGHNRLDLTRRVDRRRLLGEFLRRLQALRAKLGSAACRIYQLGDLLDLWREKQRTNQGVESFASELLADNPEVDSLLIPTSGLGANVLLGNHDLELAESSLVARARRGFRILPGGKPTILATHGDLFDALENLLPDALQAFFVRRFGPMVSGRSYRVDRTPEAPDAAFGGSEGKPPLEIDSVADDDALPDWVNVWVTIGPADSATLTESHSLLAPALACADEVRSGRKKRIEQLEIEAMPALRAIVIGHTHHARICLHRDTHDPGRNLVLADCGGWIEESEFRDSAAASGFSAVPSAQVGVFCGGDFRIYQLDPHRDLFSG